MSIGAGERFVLNKPWSSEAGLIADVGDTGTALATVEKAKLVWAELDKPLIPNYSECYISLECIEPEL